MLLSSKFTHKVFSFSTSYFCHVCFYYKTKVPNYVVIIVVI